MVESEEGTIDANFLEGMGCEVGRDGGPDRYWILIRLPKG